LSHNYETVNRKKNADIIQNYERKLKRSQKFTKGGARRRRFHHQNSYSHKSQQQHDSESHHRPVGNPATDDGVGRSSCLSGGFGNSDNSFYLLRRYIELHLPNSIRLYLTFFSSLSSSDIKSAPDLSHLHSQGDPRVAFA